MLGLLVASGPALPQAARLADTFEATTSGMTPSGLALEIDVLEWSGEEARASVIAALGEQTDAEAPLADLPTVGYLWPSGSAVGYAVKYAHRTTTADGAERITLVTGRPVGSYSFTPWEVPDTKATMTYDYTVIELDIGDEESGTGTMSLAADVVIDQASHTVSIERDESVPTVLADVMRKPKPYWAREN